MNVKLLLAISFRLINSLSQNVLICSLENCQLSNVYIEPSTFDSIEKIQLPCWERYCFSTQLACYKFGTLYLVGVQISFHQSRREILNLFWLALTRGQTTKLWFVSRNDEVHQQSRNRLVPFPIGGTKSFATSYYTVVHWSIMGI